MLNGCGSANVSLLLLHPPYTSDSDHYNNQMTTNRGNTNHNVTHSQATTNNTLQNPVGF